MIGYLKLKGFPWFISIPLGALLDLIIGVFIVEFLRSIL
jgi:hypothetical protein